MLQPGSGDSIQALKAGVMEIPDIIVINKSDHPAARTMRAEIRSVLALDPTAARRVPIVETEAFRSEGIAELWQAVLDHRADLEKDGGLEARRRQSIEHEIVAVAVAQARRRLSAALEQDPELRRLLDEVHAPPARPAHRHARDQRAGVPRPTPLKRPLFSAQPAANARRPSAMISSA